MQTSEKKLLTTVTMLYMLCQTKKKHREPDSMIQKKYINEIKKCFM